MKIIENCFLIYVAKEKFLNALGNSLKNVIFSYFDIGNCASLLQNEIEFLEEILQKFL